MFIWKTSLSFSLEDFINPGEQVTEIYTSLISVMRGTMNDEADNEQNTLEKNEIIIIIIIKIQDFIKRFASNTTTNDNSKDPISYRSYADKQIVNFITDN
jgi:hypothetical protein